MEAENEEALLAVGDEDDDGEDESDEEDAEDDDVRSSWKAEDGDVLAA